MGKFNKYMGYCGCFIGAISMMIFVVIPGFLFTFFPDLGNQLSDSFNKWQEQPHPQLSAIMRIVGPFLSLFLIVGIPIIAFSPLWLGYIDDKRKISILKKSGQKGMAKILSIQDTGITVNRNPYARLTVEIQPTHTKVEMNVQLSRLDIPSIGDSIDIIYDPSNPTTALPAYKML